MDLDRVMKKVEQAQAFLEEEIANKGTEVGVNVVFL